MKLSQLFSGGPAVEESGRVNRQQSSRTADVNSQIRSLVPGQTIRGEIVSRNGGEVQIRVADDMVLNARVDQSIHLEQGRNVTFEVKNNGRTLSLSPLFTNVATDANVLKALDMAGLSVNKTSVAMTEQLMEAGLPVNRSTLQQIYREINSFPENEISDVINLHRLQMPVDDANMRQMASYRNLTHQLIAGLTDVLESLPQAANDMLAEGNVQGAADLYRVLLTMAREQLSAPGELPAETLSGEAALAEGDLSQAAASETAAEGVEEPPVLAGAPEEALPESPKGESLRFAGELPENVGGGEAQRASSVEITGENPPRTEAGGKGAGVWGELRGSLTDRLLQTVGELRLSPQESASFAEQIRQFGEGELSTEQLFALSGRLLEAARSSGHGMAAIHKLFSGEEFGTVLTEQLKDGWTLRPEDMTRQGKVEEFYSRLDRQLRGLARVLESGGQTGSAAYRATVNVSQNVDFMNQINQIYSYVQLPLRLQHSDAHGDLYVYTNKRSFSDRNGAVSALLHLDMERLGPVDVYVTLREAKVNTKFYVADDEVLDFIEAHMDILTKRLQKRGYDCDCSTTLRRTGEETGGLAPLLQQEKGILLSQYAFDVRT